MSDMYLAENAEGDLTVWLVMPSGEDRPILSRSDLSIGRPMGLHRFDDKARAEFDAVTEAHDQLWQMVVAAVTRRSEVVCVHCNEPIYMVTAESDPVRSAEGFDGEWRHGSPAVGYYACYSADGEQLYAATAGKGAVV